MPDTTQYRIRYVINIPDIDTTFVDNRARIADLREFLRTVRDDSLLTITDVQFRGTASPDGTYEFNVWLSENRLRTFKELVRSYIDIPDSVIHSNTSDIPWDEFREKVAESDIPHRDEVLAIIDEGPSLVPFYGDRHIDPRLLKLKRMHHGKVWEALKSPILRDLRYGRAIFTVTRRVPMPSVPATRATVDFVTPKAPFDIIPYTAETWTPRIYLKTNLIGWAMANANLAFEIDMARHWSFTLPVYYSAIDWIKSTIKFRNFTVQPEFRYWFRHASNDGFFLGAHFMMSYYNFAFNGKYRYQDYRGRTPALGGGLALGWRKPFGHDRRWRVEFTAGAGVYPLDYSVFENTSDVKDGQWVERRKKTYIGLDQVAVSLGYTFDLRKRTYFKKGGAL